MIYLVLSCFMLLQGCSAAQIKKQIASDLGQIVQSQDCEDVCAKVKLYIAQKLGGTIPIPESK